MTNHNCAASDSELSGKCSEFPWTFRERSRNKTLETTNDGRRIFTPQCIPEWANRKSDRCRWRLMNSPNEIQSGRGGGMPGNGGTLNTRDGKLFIQSRLMAEFCDYYLLIPSNPSDKLLERVGTLCAHSLGGFTWHKNLICKFIISYGKFLLQILYSGLSWTFQMLKECDSP